MLKSLPCQQVVSEDNLMEAGGPLQASVRLLSGGDRDEDGNSISEEAQPQSRAQQLQLGGKLSVTEMWLCLDMPHGAVKDCINAAH